MLPGSQQFRRSGGGLNVSSCSCHGRKAARLWCGPALAAILPRATHLYKRRNRIEIMFGRLKDWRRIATRYDRSPKVFLSAVALAASAMFWI